jgi:peptidoglycan-associated lipoprotein
MDPTNPDSVGGLLARRSIYFDTDSTRVPAPYRALILAHAEWLVHNPSRGVRLSGHCDERGSREYNLSLGERRATAIKALMVLSGVSEEQVQTESFGKEKPVSFGHSELAWARNRRVDIQYGGTR